MAGLRIWLVQVGEELPIDPGPPRLLRTALLARELVSRGHDVTFWNSSFNHQRKEQRAATTTTLEIEPNYRVVLLHGRPYRRNVSLARIRSHQDNARAFRRAASAERPPDVILCGTPPFELADAVAAYAVEHGVPFAIDCRDMWPDIIADYLPDAVRAIASPVLAYWQGMHARSLRCATAITGVTDTFVEWGLSSSGRARRPLDRPFHLTLSNAEPAPADLALAERYWDDLLGPRDPDVSIGVFGGALGPRLDLPTIVAAAKALPAGDRKKVRIVICGRGDLEDQLRSAVAGEDGLYFAGWRNAVELHALMRRAEFGLLPYPSTRDFLASFPNKVGEYLFHGLPIMTGLGGVTEKLLSGRGLLLSYRTGNVASARAVLADIAARRIAPRALAAEARAAADELFNPDKIVPAFANFVEELAGAQVQRQAGLPR